MVDAVAAVEAAAWVAEAAVAEEWDAAAVGAAAALSGLALPESRRRRTG